MLGRTTGGAGTFFAEKNEGAMTFLDEKNDGAETFLAEITFTVFLLLMLSCLTFNAECVMCLDLV